MEKDLTIEHLSHDSPIKSYEQVALEALVDALFQTADREAFKVLSKILESTD